MAFSDESSVQILLDRSQYVKRKPEEKYHQDCIRKTVKHPVSVMIWSCISSKGMGRLYVVEGTMRQDQYRRVLETKLIPQLTDWFGNGPKIFMHDGAPCHKAKSVSKYLDDHRIPVLRWPGNSPDMNPIENVWNCLKVELGKDNITNKTQLIERIIHHWHHNEKLAETARNCISSMPRRIAALLKAKGRSTKY